MDCPRCQGVMVTLRLEDAEGSTSRAPVLGWRCLLCGEVLDHEIKVHRERRHQPTKNRARPPEGLMPEKKAPPQPRKTGR